MKFTLAVAASMVASAMATPIFGIDKHWGNKWGNKWGNGKAEIAKTSPFEFTSTYEVNVVPEEVVDATDMYTGGLEGAYGVYKFGINADFNTICYNITVYNFRGEYQSPAATATHIHEAPRGKSGPPRLSFPNPMEIGKDVRRSVGCLVGPFKSGVVTNGKDTADGFHVKQIEDKPEAFFTDVHSSEAVPGAIRGQLS